MMNILGSKHTGHKVGINDESFVTLWGFSWTIIARNETKRKENWMSETDATKWSVKW